MSTNYLLELKNVNKLFSRSKKEVSLAVKDVSFTVEKNEWIGIVGGSGSGKSTLVNMIAKMYEPSSGEILLNGKSIQQIPPKEYYQQIQMIFQNPLNSFSPRMKIGDFLCEPYKNFYKMTKKQAMEEVKTLVRSILLPETILSKFPHELSGGQLQRVVIARAISVKPDILICDESTSALDMRIQQEIISLLQDLRKQIAFTNIFITHDLHLAVLLCDKLYVMEKGEIVEILTKETASNPEHPYTKRLLEACLSTTVH